MSEGNIDLKHFITSLFYKGSHFFEDEPIFQKLLVNSSKLLGASTVSMIFAFVQGVIVARMLGVEQYGILALVIAYTAVLGQFVDSRVWETAIKYVTQFREQGQYDKAKATLKLSYLIDFITGGLAFLLILATANLAANWFIKDVSASGLIQIYSISILLTIPVGTSSAILRIAGRFDWLGYYTVGVAGLRLAGIGLLSLMPTDLFSVLAIYLFTSLVGTLSIGLMANRLTSQLNLTSFMRSSFRDIDTEIRQILKFTLYTNIAATSRLITSRADVLIIGWLSSPVQVGWYKLAKTVVDVLTNLFNSVYVTVYPEISRLVAQHDHQSVISLQKRLSIFFAVIIPPFCLLVMLITPWIVPLLFGSEFEPSVLMIQIMVWSTLWTIAIWVPGWLLSTDRVHILTSLNWIVALVYLFILVVSISLWGGVGAAIAMLSHYVIWTSMALALSIRINRRSACTDIQATASTR